MKKLFLLFLIVFSLSSLISTAQEKPKDNPYEKANLTSKIIDAANHTFGYDILLDGKTLIHQPSIPAMPGNEGFKNKCDAEKTAKLVISKIRKGEMPPTITVEELKNMKVIDQNKESRQKKN
jgi:hypothetical protein